MGNSKFHSESETVESIKDSLLDPILAEDVEELFGEVPREAQKKKKKLARKTTFQKEMEGIHLDSMRTLETIDRLVGASVHQSEYSGQSFEELNSKIDYKFMNSIIYK